MNGKGLLAIRNLAAEWPVLGGHSRRWFELLGYLSDSGTITNLQVTGTCSFTVEEVPSDKGRRTRIEKLPPNH